MRTHLALLPVIICLFQNIGFASTGAHGGSDNKTIPDYYAWFVGSAQGKTVNYCVSFSSSHQGIGQARITKSIESAFVQWRKYRLLRSPKKSSLVNLTPKYIGDCRRELARSDLKILVGSEPVENELFAPAMKYAANFQNPAAFSKLEAYDFKQGWGKGFIWLQSGNPYRYRVDDTASKALSWEGEDSVEMLILHEIGHLLGITHVPGTIMDENVVHRIYQDQYPSQTNARGWLTKIDDTQELLPRSSIESLDRSGTKVFISAKQYFFHFHELKETDPVGTVVWDGDITKPYEIIVDEVGPEFPIKVKPKLTKTMVTGANIFNVCLDLEVSGANDLCCGIERRTFIQAAELQWPDGARYEVLINHNIENRPEDGYGIPTRSQFIFSVDQGFDSDPQLSFIKSLSAKDLH